MEKSGNIISVYRINLRSLDNNTVNFCKENNLIGLGYKIDTRKKFTIENIEDYRKLALENYPKDARKINTFVNGFLKINIGDLVWVRMAEDYFLGKVNKLWEYAQGGDFDKYDLHNVIGLKLLSVKKESMSKEILGSFIGGGIIQRVNYENVLEESKNILEGKDLPGSSQEIVVKESKVKVYNPHEDVIKVLEKKKIKETEESQMNFGDIVIEVYPTEEKPTKTIKKKKGEIPKERALLVRQESAKELAEQDFMQGYVNLYMEMRHYYFKYVEHQMELMSNMNYMTLYMEMQFFKLLTSMNNQFLKW